MSNESVARAFREIAALLELKGEPVFKIRAYERAANQIARADDMEDLAREGKLTDLPGIGKAMADKIAYFLVTGSIPTLTELRKEIPAGLIELSTLPGLGPGRIRTLRDTLGVESMETLEDAIQNGSIRDVKGFGPKLVSEITRALDHWKRSRAYRSYSDAMDETRKIVAAARSAGATEVAVAGDLGRFREVVTSIVLVAASHSPGPFLDNLAVSADGEEREEGSVRFRTPGGLPATVRVVTPDTFGAVLAWETGAEKHRQSLIRLASEKGMIFSTDGLQREGSLLPTPDETAFFRSLGLPHLPPEIREGNDEVELAAEGKLPRLVERADIRGVLHVHSTWSDGLASIRAMAEQATAIGYNYLGLADHSRSAGYAGGLSTERLLAQGEDVRRLNTELAPFRIFHGIESDILADGSLDYDDETLKSLDFIVASIHSRFRMERKAQTERIAAALRHPSTTWLGHPTGRLLLQREPYDFDPDTIWKTAAESGKAVEMNTHEWRLDVDWRQMPALRDLGVPMPIATDAHDLEGLALSDLALCIARKGGLTPDDVPNTLDAESFAEWLRR